MYYSMLERNQELGEIYELLKKDPRDYIGYKKLGTFYKESNVNQAYLCYEQAKEFCDNIEERGILEKSMQACREDSSFRVCSVSIVILSYNAKDMMIDCLESIRSGCVPGSYEIVVVDNDSKDGIRDYLVEQKDIVLQLNDHNTSFSEGCNQGVKIANPYNDIFLLNNDTIVPPLALFYLRLALYEAEDIGSCGPMTNLGMPFQTLSGGFLTKEEWLRNASNVHVPSESAYENKVWLGGFALLIRRKVWDYIGNLDERFKKGNYEDTDYGFRLLKAGYRNVLCHNSFIYHYGSVSMKKDIAAYNKALYDNEQKLKDKLGFNFNHYTACYREMVDMLETPCEEPFSVLEIGCGLGQTLSNINYRYPLAETCGIEENAEIAKLGNKIAKIYCASIEKDILSFAEKSFDYILLTDVINRFEDAAAAVCILKRYLKKDGKLMIMAKNLWNGKSFIEILKGNWETIENIDIRVKRFYSLNRIRKLLIGEGFAILFILKMAVGTWNLSEEDTMNLNMIKNLPDVEIGEDFNVMSYIIIATVS